MRDLSPLADWQQVPVVCTQRWLRQTFATWGIPGCLRVDNGVPWGNPGDLPSALALWLIGLGIDMHWNHPRRPHENGKIERLNGLIDQWGEPARCAHWRAWQAKLRWLVHLQRERYPAVNGLSRAQAFPELFVPRQGYQASQEEAVWDFQRVKAFLAQDTWARKTDADGQVSLYHRGYHIGRAHAHQIVSVHFDARSAEWYVLDEAGHECKRWVADQITPERIRTLNVNHLRPSQRGAAKAAKIRCVFKGAA